jgi:hypothetical protein
MFVATHHRSSEIPDHEAQQPFRNNSTASYQYNQQK